MRVEADTRQIMVNLTGEEVITVQEGGAVGERRLGGLKVEIYPLSAIQEDDFQEHRYDADRLEQGRAAALKGVLSEDGDLSVYVPGIKMCDVRITSARLPRGSIEVQGQTTDSLLATIPPSGVLINFGGSLEIVDLYSRLQ